MCRWLSRTDSIRTKRLHLVPGTLELFDAELQGHQQLAAALRVDRLEDWPKSDSTYDDAVVRFFRSQLVEDPRSRAGDPLRHSLTAGWLPTEASSAARSTRP